MAKIFRSDLIGVQESVSQDILLLNPYMIPLLSRLGFSEPIANTKHEWYEDSMFAYETLVNGAKLDTDTTITVDDGSIFRVNHIIRIGEELLKVTAVNGNDLTVSRGYAGTTAAAIADNARVEILFVEGEEGADARAGRFKQRVNKYNYTQIIDETIEVSGTALAMAEHATGGMNPYDREQSKKMQEVALQLEKALINGVRYSNGQVRQMGGLRYFLTTNVIDASTYTDAKISMDMINDLVQDCWEAGAFKTPGNFVFMVPAAQKRKISALDVNNIRIDRADNATGHVVERLVTDFGEFPIFVNNNLDASEVMFVDLNRLAVRPIVGRSFFHEYLGKKGDYVQGQIVGEYTLEVQQEAAMGRVKNLATA